MKPGRSKLCHSIKRIDRMGVGLRKGDKNIRRGKGMKQEIKNFYPRT
jgi:hypothetical protein